MSRFMTQATLASKGNNKFGILLVKILAATIEKIYFSVFKKIANGSFRSGITMGKCKTKFIPI